MVDRLQIGQNRVQALNHPVPQGGGNVPPGQGVRPGADVPDRAGLLTPRLGEADGDGPPVLGMGLTDNQLLLFHFVQQAGHGGLVDGAPPPDVPGALPVLLQQAFQHLGLAGKKAQLRGLLGNQAVGVVKAFHQQEMQLLVQQGNSPLYSLKSNYIIRQIVPCVKRRRNNKLPGWHHAGRGACYWGLIGIKAAVPKSLICSTREPGGRRRWARSGSWSGWSRGSRGP